MRGWISLALLCLLPVGATAQEVSDCDWRASADAIVEPWADNSRSFANGAVRLAVLDAIEPAAGALHLLVLSPPFDELGARQCKLVSWQGGVGFVMMDFAGLRTDYDPAKGLLFDLPVRFYLPDLEFSNSALLSITLNQSTGAITVNTQLGNE